MERKFCFHCGAQLPPEARFCFQCGTKQQLDFTPSPSDEDVKKADEEVIPQEEPAFDAPDASLLDEQVKTFTNKPFVKEKRKSKGFELGRSIAVLAISVLMLIMAFFPVFKVRFEQQNIEVPVMLSTIDNMVLLVDSFQNLEADELLDTRLSEEARELSEDLDKELQRLAEKKGLSRQSMEYDDLSGYAKELMNRAAILVMRLACQSEELIPSPMFIIVAVLSLLYILVCVAAVVVSVLHLLSVVGVLKAQTTSLSKITVALLCAVPMMLALLYLAMFFRYSFGMSSASLGWAGIVTMISFAVLLAGLVTYRFVIAKKRACLSAIIKHSVSVVVAVVLLVLLTAPIFTTTLEAVFSDKMKERQESFSTNVSFFERLHLTKSESDFGQTIFEEYDMKQFENLMEEHVEALESYTAKDFREGKASAANRQYLLDLSASWGMHEFYWLFYLISILYLLIAIGACLSLWSHMTWFADGGYCYVVDRVSKYTSCICATLALVLAIVFIVLIGSYLDGYKYDRFYTIGISAGIIFMGIFAIGGILAPARIQDERQKKEDFEEEYIDA